MMAGARMPTPPPLPTQWNGPQPILDQSPFYVKTDPGPEPIPGKSIPLATVDNRAAINFLLDRLRKDFALHDRWLLAVPGTSEFPTHHTAYRPQPGEDPDVDVVSPEFRARIDHAHTLLKLGRVQSILLSGGSIDVNAPWYCEAKCGLHYLLGRHGREWDRGELERRVLVDPWALHTECNVRNAERVASLLGLDRCSFVTTARDGKIADQGRLFELPFVFAPLFRGSIGYGPGTFARVGANNDPLWNTNVVPGVSFATRAYDAWGFDAASLLLDGQWATKRNGT
jgi:hypothetical protein